MEKNNILEAINSKISERLFADALLIAQTFLKKNPLDLDILFIEGICHFEIGSYEKSIEIFKKILSQQPNFWNAHFALAKNYRRLQKPNISIQYFLDAIKLNSTNYQLLLEYADFLIEQNKNSIAEKVLNNLIAQEPDNFKAYYYLGLNFLSKFEEKKSLELLLRANKLCSNNPQILNSIGTCYERLSDYDKATSYFLKSNQANNLFLLPLLNLAVMQQSLGNFEDSKSIFKNILNQDPYNGEAYRYLSIMKKFKDNDPEISEMKNIYEQISDDENKMHLGFALSKALEDIGDYKNSSYYLIKSNSFRRKQFVNYNIHDEVINFNYLKQVLNYDFYLKNHQYGFISDLPIFIVGMPRSGTTLVEQIISSHSLVKAGGELNELSKALNSQITYSSTADMFSKIQKLSPQNIKQIGKVYNNNLKFIDPKAKHITDKLPVNFQLVCLILTCLPNAKIIHCTRNAGDNCLSIYKNYFWQHVMPWSYDQVELNNYYYLYKDLMNFYNNNFRSKIFNINYENLISEPEYYIKNLLNFCNLDWEDNCLKFYENKNAVKTASVAQVRSKFYISSVNSWKKYEEFLPDLFNNLK